MVEKSDKYLKNNIDKLLHFLEIEKWTNSNNIYKEISELKGLKLYYRVKSEKSIRNPENIKNIEQIFEIYKNKKKQIEKLNNLILSGEYKINDFEKIPENKFYQTLCSINNLFNKLNKIEFLKNVYKDEFNNHPLINMEIFNIKEIIFNIYNSIKYILSEGKYDTNAKFFAKDEFIDEDDIDVKQSKYYTENYTLIKEYRPDVRNMNYYQKKVEIIPHVINIASEELMSLRIDLNLPKHILTDTIMEIKDELEFYNTDFYLKYNSNTNYADLFFCYDQINKYGNYSRKIIEYNKKNKESQIYINRKVLKLALLEVTSIREIRTLENKLSKFNNFINK